MTTGSRGQPVEHEHECGEEDVQEAEGSDAQETPTTTTAAATTRSTRPTFGTSSHALCNFHRLEGFLLGAFIVIVILFATTPLDVPRGLHHLTTKTALDELASIQTAYYQHVAQLQELAGSHALRTAQLNNEMWTAVARVRDESPQCTPDGRDNACKL